MTAADKIVFDVEYAEACKGCEAAGRPGVATGMSLERGGIVCASGQHTGNQVTGEEPAAAPKPAQTQEPQQLRTDGAFAPRGRRPAAVAQNDEVESCSEPLPEPAPLPAGVQEHVTVTNVRDAAGGDLEITLRIPDRHADAVKGEAEVQRKSVAVYLQEWIEFALDNHWGR